MKVLTKEEEDAHYAATLRGGLKGGLLGLTLGLSTAYLLHKRTHFFRTLTLPIKSFYVTSIGTFFAIISADRSSRSFESSRHSTTSLSTSSYLHASRTPSQKLTDWAHANRYKIVVGSWVASMAGALGVVSRDRYLTRAQKLVQARVYAQGLTLLVLVATAAFEVVEGGGGGVKEGEEDDRFEVVVVEDGKGGYVKKRVHREQYAGEDLWRDIVEAEEKRLERRRGGEEKAREEERKRSKGLKEKEREIERQ